MLFISVALAEQVVLRNDTNTTDTYDEADQVAWLAYPECAVSVLEADAADLPLAIDTVYVYLGSNTGNQDGEDTVAVRAGLGRRAGVVGGAEAAPPAVERSWWLR